MNGMHSIGVPGAVIITSGVVDAGPKLGALLPSALAFNVLGRES